MIKNIWKEYKKEYKKEAKKIGIRFEKTKGKPIKSSGLNPLEVVGVDSCGDKIRRGWGGIRPVERGI